VTDRHEVFPPFTQFRHELDVLAALEADTCVSQRSIARRVGIALGSANLVIRHLVRRGCVRVVRTKDNRLEYVITPFGFAEKARMMRHEMAVTLNSYTRMRACVRERLLALSNTWPRGAAAAAKRIAFYGAGEVAEIGFACLQSLDFHLVGVVDPRRPEPFFGMRVHPLCRLATESLAGRPFEVLVIMTFDNIDVVFRELESVNFAPSRAFWI
jgi:predicted transcriptional regulator